MSYADLFANADAAPPPGSGGVYFPVGTFVVRVDRFFRHTNRQRVRGVIAECTVLHSSNPALPAGSAVSWMQREGKEGWESRVRKFVAEVQDVDYGETKADVLMAATSDSNPLGGKVLMATGKPVNTKAGKPIVGVDWERLPAADRAGWLAHAKTVEVAVPQAQD